MFQERFLSRRLVVFSKSGIFLQCQTGPPQSVAGNRVQFDMVSLQGSEEEQSVFEQRKATTNILEDRRWRVFEEASVSGIDYKSWVGWHLLVERYSGLELTCLEEDRLIALFGIATKFGCSFRGQNDELD